MSDSKTCPSCGHPNSLDARFCGRCGTPLPAHAPAPAPARVPTPARPSTRDENKTMLGALIDPASLKPEEPVAPTPAARAPQKTMMAGGFEEIVRAAQQGMVPPSAPTAAAPVVAPPQASSTRGLSASPMSAPEAAAPVAPAAPVTPAAPAAPAAPVAPAAPAAAAPVAEAPAPAPASAPPSRRQFQTMIGVGLQPVPAAKPMAEPPPVDPSPSPAATPAAAPSASTTAPFAGAPAAPMDEATAQTGRPVHDTLLDQPLEPPPGAAPLPFAEPASATAPAAPEPAAPEPPPPAPAPPPEAVPAAAPPSRAMHRTMVGMPAPLGASPVAPAAPDPVPAPAPVTPPSPEPAAPVAAPAPSAPVAPSAPMPAAAPKRNLGPSNRTMLGVAAPLAGVAGSSVVPEPPPAAAPAYTPAPASSAEISSTDVSLAGLPSPRRRTRGWLVALLVLGVLLVGGVTVAALYHRLTQQRVDVTASVTSGASGEVLAVEVQRAPEGTHARFGTIDQVVTGTHVDLPLAADALHVGDNDVAIDIVLPDGAVETHHVTLTVEYRVRADLSTLGATPAAITVLVDAMPGSTVTLDATPLALDAQGHGSRAYPVATLTPDASGTITLTAHYTIAPPTGVPATSTLTARVGATPLHLDRPGDPAQTDQTAVIVAGTTQPGASVTVEGAAATVSSDGHFTFDAPLPAVGAREIHVTASMPQRAPATRVLHVERVPDLGRAAAAYPVDRTLSYERVAAAPASFTGQHVAMEGRIYNVDLQDGHGVLQMLARECPSGQRCPVWVTHPAVTEVAVEGWVRVVGVVGGEQQFRSQSGELRTVPRIDAVYVIPLAR